MSAVAVGIGEREITPQHPLPLAGFASRKNQSFEGVDRKLWVRAWWIGEGADAFLLVIADVLWWAPERVQLFRESVSSQWQIPVEHILLHATHTHSGPQTSYVFTESLGSPDDEWVEYFESQALAVIAAAQNDLSPAHLTRYRGSSNIGYNRRVRIDEPDSAEENDGLVDSSLTVLQVTHPDGSPRGLLFHHACHPTITSSPRVSSEWPGVACELLREQHGVVSMMQGTCGDINPRVTRGRTERNLTDDDVQAVAAEIAGDVTTALSTAGQPIDIQSVTARIARVECATLSVPDESHLATAESNEGLAREWASALRRFPHRCVPTQPLDITHISLGDSLSFVALSAEVTTAYGLAIKDIAGLNAIPLGYTNGMTGYIVTDRQLQNGGYEPQESTEYFALPSPFAPGLEGTVMAGIRSVIGPKVNP